MAKLQAVSLASIGHDPMPGRSDHIYLKLIYCKLCVLLQFGPNYSCASQGQPKPSLLKVVDDFPYILL